MPPFDFDPSIRVCYGSGRLAELGDLARGLSAGHALLVSDPGIVQAGFVDRACACLEAAGVNCVVFTEVGENPSTVDIEAGVDAARSGTEPDLIVAVGGGSAMDCAKGINFVLTNGGKIEDYHGFGKATKPMLPSIGVPTTAGTGSEAQSYALISQAETHTKMACGDRKARFHTVILDPDLIGSAPRSVKAAAGYDAVAHAVESYVCTKANPVSKMYAERGFRLLDGSVDDFVNERSGAVAGDVLLGAHFAGMAIETSMLGAAHACANPLTASFGTTHGIAVALMLPVVVEHNVKSHVDRYEGLTDTPGLAERLRELRDRVGLPGRLADIGVSADAIPALAEAASEQWTGTFNPAPVNRSICEALYEAAL